MLSRIQQIIEDKGVTLSAFADEIGVKRTTIVHTMSGRNNPSLDIVTKILERYSDISSDWLIFGRGTKHKSTAPVQQDLFGESMQHLEEKLNSNSSPLGEEKNQHATEPQNPLQISDIRFAESEKKIDRIMIFYSDKSYQTFIPEIEDKK